MSYDGRMPTTLQANPNANPNPDTYLFCDDLVVAPITSPADPITRLSTRMVWLPPGSWVELGR